MGVLTWKEREREGLNSVPMIPLPNTDLEEGGMEDDLPTYEEATGPEAGKYSRQTSHYRNLVRQATVIATGNSDVTEETVDQGSQCFAVFCIICFVVTLAFVFIYFLWGL